MLLFIYGNCNNFKDSAFCSLLSSLAVRILCVCIATWLLHYTQGGSSVDSSSFGMTLISAFFNFMLSVIDTASAHTTISKSIATFRLLQCAIIFLTEEIYNKPWFILTYTDENPKPTELSLNIIRWLRPEFSDGNRICQFEPWSMILWVYVGRSEILLTFVCLADAWQCLCSSSYRICLIIIMNFNDSMKCCFLSNKQKKR